LTIAQIVAEIPLRIRAIIDDRRRRVWPILIGMSVLAVTSMQRFLPSLGQ
jgi:hypothetical protein